VAEAVAEIVRFGGVIERRGEKRLGACGEGLVIARVTGFVQKGANVFHQAAGFVDFPQRAGLGEMALLHGLKLAADEEPAARGAKVVDGAMIALMSGAGLDEQATLHLEAADGEGVRGFPGLEADAVEEDAIAAEAAGRAEPGGGAHERGWNFLWTLRRCVRSTWV